MGFLRGRPLFPSQERMEELEQMEEMARLVENIFRGDGLFGVIS